MLAHDDNSRVLTHDDNSRTLTDSRMDDLIRSHDWSGTPIGTVDNWSPALKMMVGFLLANRFPLLLWWGPRYVSIYNDAYCPILGTKHPKALGQPVSECWSEIWHILQPLIDTPFHGGPSTWMEDLPLEINRHGFVEETHFTVAYSPVPDEAVPHGIGGVLATVHEITDKIIGERRVAVLRDLASITGDASSVEEACAHCMEMLASHAKDIPFALLYLIDDDGSQAQLAASVGLGDAQEVCLPAVGLREAANSAAAWPLAEAVQNEAMVTVENLAARFATVPAGPWSDPPNRAVVIPVQSNRTHQLAGLLVAGVSPRLALDDRYRDFLRLAAAQVATSIATARAYEEERRRAEALAAIDRAKTVFFSNISHEFRTPLTLMLAPLEDVLNAPSSASLADDQRQQLIIAHRNSLRLLKLVNALLDFSRIEAGRIQARYAPTDLAALTADLASGFRSVVNKADLFLDIDCNPLPATVYVDRDMWEKVVLNLLSNAFKFTFAGGIAVTLRAADDRAILTICDSGVGVPEAELPHLFERFHRIEGQRGRSYEGTGIGLSLVQELVRLHGGTISAQRNPDRGLTFTVSLPFGTAHLPADRIGGEQAAISTAMQTEAFAEEALRWLPDKAAAPFDEAAAAAATGPLDRIDGKRPHVLVVDDNADMRDYMRHLLGEHYEVATAPNGQAALSAIRHARPDLVLTDVMMPVLDGFGLLHEIRTDPALRDLLVILVSARAGDEARAEGLDAGADDYLTKPFSTRELLARVRTKLTMVRLRRDTAEALQRRNARLATRVAKEIGARELLQTQLMHALRLEALDKLAGGISHDFNNLLQTITSGLALIERRAENAEEVRKLAYLTGASAERGAAISRRLLTFARPRELRTEPVAPVPLLRALREILVPTLGASISVEIRAEEDTPSLLADKSQLEAVLVSLAVNARDAMPEGGTLTIAAQPEIVFDDQPHPAELAAGTYLRLDLTDTGSGMEAAILEHALEPFFTTKPAGQGPGIGLPMARAFAKQSKGGLRIQSTPGQGTTVTLWLPQA